MVIDPISLVAAKEVAAGLMKPLIEKSLKVLGGIPSALTEAFTDKFGSYMDLLYERHAYLNTLVLGEQKNLMDLYIPLTVIPSTSEEDEGKGIVLDKFRREFLPSHNRVLVTDTAGMGKSTLMKFLFLQCIKTQYAIPIFVELRHLSQNRSVLDLIEQQLNFGSLASESTYFDRNRIEKVTRSGGLIFFFDGFDEISFKDREKVTLDLKSFIDSHAKNIFVITSRPETGLSAFPNFKQYTIRPLKKEESFELIKKYDNNGTRSQQLIERLRGREFKSVMEFLKNPLLTTLLYRCFEYKQSLPPKKHVFYRQVFDALFDWHDSTKDGYNTREKRSNLDIDSFHRVLRVMGFISVMKGEVEGDTDTILSWIRDAKKQCVGLSFSESDFLDDIVRAVPIFVRDGNYYRWSHKSLSEYFAAQYICTEGKEAQAKIFTNIWNSKKLIRFENMLDQIYDIDNSAFRKYFILPVAKEFSSYWKTSYVGFAGSFPGEMINLRKSVCFGANYKLASKISDDELRNYFSGVNMEERLNAGEIPIGVMFHHHNKGPIIVLSFHKPCFSILQILQDKKDPLILNRSKIDLSSITGYPTQKSIKKPVDVSDDESSEINSKRNFNAATKLIVQSPNSVIVDYQRMLDFERAINDEVTASEFADDFLIPT